MGDSFQAVWFAASGGSQPCRVELGAGSLVIEPAGGAMVRWPYPALRSDIGGDDREWGFLSCPPASGNARLALHDPAVILALAALTSGPVHDDLTGLDAARRRDALRGLVGRLGGSLVIALMLGSGDLARITGQAGALDQLAYGRNQERAADRDGVLLLARAGLPPAALPAFFERLQAREAGGLPEFLSTHPDTAARIVELRRLAAATPGADPRPLAIDWEAVRASLPGH